jgi:hypothetical protein
MMRRLSSAQSGGSPIHSPGTGIVHEREEHSSCAPAWASPDVHVRARARSTASTTGCPSPRSWPLTSSIFRGCKRTSFCGRTRTGCFLGLPRRGVRKDDTRTHVDDHHAHEFWNLFGTFPANSDEQPKSPLENHVVRQSLTWWAHKDSNLGPAD